MQNDELDGLLALKLVGEKLSFTTAAHALGISPSRVSQVIKQLESRLGVALVSRTTRSISLTEAGDQFLQQAGPGLDQVLNALQNVSQFAQKPSGLLRLNMPQTFYSKFFAPIVQTFLEKYPEVSIEIFSENSSVDVVEGGFDAGVRLSEILEQDMIATKLVGPLNFVVAAAPKYWKKHGRPKHPNELLEHNCIRSRLGKSGLYDRWEFEHRGREFSVQVKGNQIFNEGAAAWTALLAGTGIVYGIEEFLQEEIKAGKLEVVLRNFAPSSPGLFLYYPKRSQLQPKLRAFIDHIKGQSTK